MKTLLLSAQAPETASIAADLIQKGELVAIPTETVYGLGANGLDEEAVAKIFQAKGRPQDNPLILHICGPEQIELFCHHIPQSAYDLAAAFWPGPLTLVLPARDVVPRRTTGGLDTVAVRCPDNAVTREIIRLFRCSHCRPLRQHLRQALHHHRPARASRPRRQNRCHCGPAAPVG